MHEPTYIYMVRNMKSLCTADTERLVSIRIGSIHQPLHISVRISTLPTQHILRLYIYI